MMKNLTLKTLSVSISASLLFPLAANASTIDVNFGELNFGATSGTDQPAAIGVGAGLGFTHRYDDVIAGVDAIATITSIQNLDSDDDQSNGANGFLDEFDDRDSTTGKAIDLGLDVFGASGATETGNVTFRIDFVAADTNNAVTLEKIAMRVVDIDSRQYASFAGITAYELSATPATELTVTSSGGVYEFKEPLGASSSSSDQENWVTVEYSAASSITVTLGARESGGATFGVSFNDTTWSSAPTRPTFSLTQYSLTYDGNSATSGVVPGTQNSTTSSSSVTLSAAQGNLLRTNCTFGGWNTRADGTGANFLNAGTINLTSNTTLYANWTCTTPPAPSSAPASTAPPTATPPLLAATGWATSGAWITAGALVGFGLTLIGVRSFVGRNRQYFR